MFLTMWEVYHRFFACGRAEETVYFRWFGGKAAKPTEKDSPFLAAAGENALFCGFGRERPKPQKETSISLLPQAKKALAA
jgi:hypothetical protein